MSKISDVFDVFENIAIFSIPAKPFICLFSRMMMVMIMMRLMLMLVMLMFRSYSSQSGS